MAQLNSKKRARLPKSAFAYVDSKGRRRLPINDESHVRNALSRFNQVAFEDDEARERAVPDHSRRWSRGGRLSLESHFGERDRVLRGLPVLGSKR